MGNRYVREHCKVGQISVKPCLRNHISIIAWLKYLAGVDVDGNFKWRTFPLFFIPLCLWGNCILKWSSITFHYTITVLLSFSLIYSLKNSLKLSYVFT